MRSPNAASTVETEAFSRERIVFIGVLNEAEYEWAQHERVFVGAGGTLEQMDAMRNPDVALGDSNTFDEMERATLALTYEMIRHVAVADATMGRVRALLPDPTRRGTGRRHRGLQHGVPVCRRDRRGGGIEASLSCPRRSRRGSMAASIRHPQWAPRSDTQARRASVVGTIQSWCCPSQSRVSEVLP